MKECLIILNFFHVAYLLQQKQFVSHAFCKKRTFFNGSHIASNFLYLNTLRTKLQHALIV